MSKALLATGPCAVVLRIRSTALSRGRHWVDLPPPKGGREEREPQPFSRPPRSWPRPFRARSGSNDSALTSTCTCGRGKPPIPESLRNENSTNELARNRVGGRCIPRSLGRRIEFSAKSESGGPRRLVILSTVRVNRGAVHVGPVDLLAGRTRASCRRLASLLPPV